MNGEQRDRESQLQAAFLLLTAHKVADAWPAQTPRLRDAAVACPTTHPLAALAALPETSNLLSTPVAALLTPSSTTVNVFLNLQANSIASVRAVFCYGGSFARRVLGAEERLSIAL